MEMDEKTLDHLRTLAPREIYDTVRLSVLKNPWGSSSEDMQAALEQVVSAGILTWDEIEDYESA